MKTTNDLLVLRSDCYRPRRATTSRSTDGVDAVPFVDLDPSTTSWSAASTSASPTACRRCRRAEELVVEGDWTFGAGVTVDRARRTLDGAGGRVDGGHARLAG